MDSTSKIRVYTNGIEADGIGAYAYIVLEGKCLGDIKIGSGAGRAFAPSLLRAKFAQAGRAADDMRMKMRAVYEGVRHCPDGTSPEVYTDNFLISPALDTTKLGEEDGDIADRYRNYIAAHRITPQFMAAKVYNDRDLPANDHDEWTWYALALCKYAIRRFVKENKK